MEVNGDQSELKFQHVENTKPSYTAVLENILRSYNIYLETNHMELQNYEGV